MRGSRLLPDTLQPGGLDPAMGMAALCCSRIQVKYPRRLKAKPRLLIGGAGDDELIGGESDRIVGNW